ncbi:F-box protein [Abeliophyllum distichum]|uniref:F-box protein n=1 Tax=Abeliophyllum distichum TaxID=126358 RepID=A0ABD1QJY9_9LAMI
MRGFDVAFWKLGGKGEGRRFLVQANAGQLAAVLAATPSAALASDSWLTWNPVQHHRHLIGAGCPLLSDFGCNIPAPKSTPASPFLSDWFSIRGGNPCPGLRLCSHAGCGQPETQRHEFRWVFYMRSSELLDVLARRWTENCTTRWSAPPWRGGLKKKLKMNLTLNGGGDDGNGNGNGDEAIGWGRTLI